VKLSRVARKKEARKAKIKECIYTVLSWTLELIYTSSAIEAFKLLVKILSKRH
jgi:hypothetical protein